MSEFPRDPADPNSRRSRHYAWFAVALLWFCGFFNYADRQAVAGVLPLLQLEFSLNDKEKGLLGSAFMVVYAGASPFAGWLVDRFSRRWLIGAGLAFWSLICAATALAQTFGQLLWFRALEGLGESFYFPASMSLLADYHGPRTRSRAMSLHQTSVYVGSAVGVSLAGRLGAHSGWRSPFRVLGLVGLAYAMALPWLLREPRRAGGVRIEPEFASRRTWFDDLRVFARLPATWALFGAFFAANFVAAAFLSWLPDYVYRKFVGDVEGAANVAAFPWPLANLAGALLGGYLADKAARRFAGGRAGIQGVGLLLGTPCIYMVGATDSLAVLVVALVLAGFCKGLYDANIFASLYDVVPPESRGVAAGLMNTVGWTGGLLAPFLVGVVSDQSSLSHAMTALAAFYVAAGLLALSSVWLARSPDAPRS